MTGPVPISAELDPVPGRSPRSRSRAVVGFVIGIALFAAALWAIITGGPDIDTALRSARCAPWWLVASVVLLPALNWLTVSTSFQILQSRYAPVGRVEMAALIASAWLLNYLPLKPGMFGRLAYHKKINGIRYKDSVRVLLISVGLTGVSIGVLLAIAVLVRISPASWGWAWCLPVPVGLGIASASLYARSGWAWRLAAAALLRYVDTMLWIARYAASFALIGSPLDFETALVVAAVSQIALLVPVAGNGLGIREWGVRAATEPIGLLADVVNRAAEVVVSIPLGLTGSVYAARRLAKQTKDRETALPERKEP